MAALQSATLLAGRKAVDIVHNGTVYRLQATRLGKLILTK
jgi:hemin uptake protein HemP